MSGGTEVCDLQHKRVLFSLIPIWLFPFPVSLSAVKQYPCTGKKKMDVHIEVLLPPFSASSSLQKLGNLQALLAAVAFALL